MGGQWGSGRSGVGRKVMGPNPPWFPNGGTHPPRTMPGYGGPNCPYVGAGCGLLSSTCRHNFMSTILATTIQSYLCNYVATFLNQIFWDWGSWSLFQTFHSRKIQFKPTTHHLQIVTSNNPFRSLKNNVDRWRPINWSYNPSFIFIFYFSIVLIAMRYLTGNLPPPYLS